MISTEKARPSNGPGANGLRGGRNIYCGKTAVGPWLDAVGGPSGYTRGFSTNSFQTEAQHQQLGVGRKPAPYFGAGLPKAVDIKSPTASDTLNNGLTPDWKTTTSIMTTYHDKPFVSEGSPLFQYLLLFLFISPAR